MTTTINITTKTKKIVYWLPTAVTATAYLAMGTADLLHMPAMAAGLAHLGYPVYLATSPGAAIAAAPSSFHTPRMPKFACTTISDARLAD